MEQPEEQFMNRQAPDTTEENSSIPGALTEEQRSALRNLIREVRERE